ncbi:helix-turn-helix transcriptional regulator [bacterium]|nr:helix-turn-helix transcriptional regulator [bacterium]
MDDKVFLKNLGLKIKVARTIKGLSQEDLMGALGIDKSYLSKLERGLANPSILYLRQIANYLDISLSELIT